MNLVPANTPGGDIRVIMLIREPDPELGIDLEMVRPNVVDSPITIMSAECCIGFEPQVGQTVEICEDPEGDGALFLQLVKEQT